MVILATIPSFLCTGNCSVPTFYLLRLNGQLTVLESAFYLSKCGGCLLLFSIFLHMCCQDSIYIVARPIFYSLYCSDVACGQFGMKVIQKTKKLNKKRKLEMKEKKQNYLKDTYSSRSSSISRRPRGIVPSIICVM
jgi:hypothetical protein